MAVWCSLLLLMLVLSRVKWDGEVRRALAVIGLVSFFASRCALCLHSATRVFPCRMRAQDEQVTLALRHGLFDILDGA